MSKIVKEIEKKLEKGTTQFSAIEVSCLLNQIRVLEQLNQKLKGSN